MSIYTHKHHIIPRHMGGSDDPENLVELTVEEHAEAHRQLYEEHGRWQDRIAWKTLSGQISMSEAKRQAAADAKRGKPLTEDHKQKLSAAKMGKNNPNYGKPRSEDTRSKIAKGQHKKPVIGTDPSGTEHRFSSATDAARALGFSRAHIVRCCGGHRPHHHGWEFSYE